jgi:hypothetical protein
VSRKQSKVSGNPDIEILADVKAERLRFEEVPDTEVRFRGYPERRSVSGTERENLPDEVERNVVYRDIKVSLRIASELAQTQQGSEGPDRSEARDVAEYQKKNHKKGHDSD